MTQNKPRDRPNKLRNFPTTTTLCVDAKGSKVKEFPPRDFRRDDPHFERYDLHDYIPLRARAHKP